MLPIGTYYPMDSEGRILNRASEDLVPNHWKILLPIVVEIYRRYLGKELHSVWLRGSVPAGTAVDGVSDLDTFALLKWHPGQEFHKWTVPHWAVSEGERLTKSYGFVSEVELVCSSWDENNTNRYPAMCAMLQTQSLLIFGENIAFGNPPRLVDLKRNTKWIASDWEAFQAGPEDEKTMRTFIKTFLRGVFEMYMEDLGQYATDFYPCVAAISVYHPKWRSHLEEMVEIYATPDGKGGRLEVIAGQMMSELGDWDAE